MSQKSAETESPVAEDVHEVGTISQILQIQPLPDNSIRVFVEGQEAARALRYRYDGKILTGELEPLEFINSVGGKRLLALERAVLKQFETYARLSDKIPEDLFLNIKNIDDPLGLCNAIANYCSFKTAALLAMPRRDAVRS